MTHDYTPRRCSKRWLDADCPPEVLAIIAHPHTDVYGGGFDVIYTDVQTVTYEGSRRVEKWMSGLSLLVSGAVTEHFEMEAHKIAAYRYRFKHRYATWSSLPDAVKTAVRRDLASCNQCGDAGPFTFEKDVCDRCVRSNTGVNA